MTEEDEAHRDAMKKLQQEQRDKIKSKPIKKMGLVLVNTGDGKGKSTASLGLALRAVGTGMKVAFIQFIKGTWKTGEAQSLRRFPEIDHMISGEGFSWNTQDKEKDRAAAARGLEMAREAFEASRGDEPKYDLVILDELNVALGLEQLALEDVLALVRDKPPALHLCITGRGAPDELIALAHTVTEMKPIKHAFEQGIRAQKGIEF